MSFEPVLLTGILTCAVMTGHLQYDLFASSPTDIRACYGNILTVNCHCEIVKHVVLNW